MRRKAAMLVATVAACSDAEVSTSLGMLAGVID
jgi:hypothetical protein